MGNAANRLLRVSGKLRSLPDTAVTDGSRRLAASVLREMEQPDVFGADLRLSGMRRADQQTVVTTKRTRNGGRTVVGQVKGGPPTQRAPLFWKEKGTPAGPRRSRRAYRGNHPGTPATRFWTRTTNKTLPEVQTNIERRWRNALH